MKHSVVKRWVLCVGVLVLCALLVAGSAEAAGKTGPFDEKKYNEFVAICKAGDLEKFKAKLEREGISGLLNGR